MSTRAGVGARTGVGKGAGAGTIIEIQVEGRESGNLRSCDRDGSEDARGGAAPTSNQ